MHPRNHFKKHQEGEANQFMGRGTQSSDSSQDFFKGNFSNCYARNLILVTLILVNFFGFLVITRYHEIFEGCQ